MYLMRLIYASEKSDDFEVEDIQQILGVARKNNAELGVTGLLCFNRCYFLQCLEGGREAVNMIYHRISNDSRHKKILLLSYDNIQEREFSEWGMGYIPESSLSAPTHLKYSRSTVFDPAEMSGESCHKLLLELRDKVPVL